MREYFSWSFSSFIHCDDFLCKLKPLKHQANILEKLSNFPLQQTDSIAQHIHMVKKCMVDWERACLYLKPYCSERKLKKALLIVCFNLEPYMLLNAHMSFERSIEFHWDLNLNFKILEIFASLGSQPQLFNSEITGFACYI